MRRTGRRWLLAAILAALCAGPDFGTEPVGSAFAGSPCTGHNMTKHGRVHSGRPIATRANVKVGERDPVWLPAGVQTNLGYACPGTELRFHARAWDDDTHVCLAPPTEDEEIKNYILNPRRAHVNVTRPFLWVFNRRVARVPLESPEGAANVFVRTWRETGVATIREDQAGQTLTLTFRGKVRDLRCRTHISGQNHRSSQDRLARLRRHRARLTVPKVEISRPRGNPALSATDWNNPDSDRANVGNERTFTGGNSPGVATVTVPCVASIEPAAAADAIAARLRWSIDDVGSIRAVWNPHVDGDPHTGKGLASTATFTTTADGLPVDNDAFGLKVVRLRVEGMDCDELTTNVEVFYMRDSKNHAGGQAGSPNWFHYWMQARPNPDVVFNPTLGFGILGNVPGMTDWSYHNEPNKTLIELGPTLPGAGRQYDVGKLYSGIDHMIGTVIHEERHVQQIAAADALMPPTDGNDSFRYGWSWNQPIHNHWNEGPDGKWGVADVDDDGNGIVDDAAPLPPFEPGWPGSDDISLDHPDWEWWPNAWPLPLFYAENPNLHPIEVEAVRHADDKIDEHDYWEQDWGNPGKQHKTNKKWDD